MGNSTGDENANLYTRGVNEGYNGDLLDASDLLDVLDVFGEDGLRMYLVGFLEGEENAAEHEAAADPDAREVIADYETGEITPSNAETRTTSQKTRTARRTQALPKRP